MSVGPWQIIIIVLIILLLFGAGRLSEIGKGLGEGIKNFKKGIADDQDEDRQEVAQDKKKKKSQEPNQLPAKKGKALEDDETERSADEES
jgi:sec-independent protein translocase protein TatA